MPHTACINISFPPFLWNSHFFLCIHHAWMLNYCLSFIVSVLRNANHVSWLICWSLPLFRDWCIEGVCVLHLLHDSSEGIFSFVQFSWDYWNTVDRRLIPESCHTQISFSVLFLVSALSSLTHVSQLNSLLRWKQEKDNNLLCRREEPPSSPWSLSIFFLRHRWSPTLPLAVSLCRLIAVCSWIPIAVRSRCDCRNSFLLFSFPVVCKLAGLFFGFLFLCWIRFDCWLTSSCSFLLLVCVATCVRYHYLPLFTGCAWTYVALDEICCLSPVYLEQIVELFQEFVLFEKSFAQLSTAPVAIGLSSGIVPSSHISSSPFPKSINKMVFLHYPLVSFRSMDDAVRFLATVDRCQCRKERFRGLTNLFHIGGPVVVFFIRCFIVWFCLVFRPSRSRIHTKTIICLYCDALDSPVCRKGRKEDGINTLPINRILCFSSSVSVNFAWPLSSCSRFGCASYARSFNARRSMQRCFLLSWRHFRFYFINRRKRRFTATATSQCALISVE